MFQHLESHATSIHESTSQIVDNLIEFILRSYYTLEQKAAEGIRHLTNRDPKEQLEQNLTPSKPLSVELQVNGKQVYEKLGSQETVNQLTQENLNQLKAAFDRPELVEGSVCILIDNKPVLRIEEGQVLQDDLSLTSNQTQRLEASLKPENNSERLITQAGRLLITNYGYEVSENVSAFHGHNYCYEQSNKSLSIRAYGRGDVFKDGEFTALATGSDRQTLSQLPDKVEQQITQDRQSQQQQTKKQPSLSRSVK